MTVTKITDRSDVDPSTFFRHFPSKESVLFTELRAQVVIRREQVALDLAGLLGERFGVDPGQDARPYLAATVWLAAFDWYRRHLVSAHDQVMDAAGAVDEIVTIVESVGRFFELTPKQSTGGPTPALGA